MGIRALVLRGLASSTVPALIVVIGCSIDQVTFRCQEDRQCDDQDLCTRDVCEPEGRCSHDPDDGASGRACGAGEPSRCYAGKCLPCTAVDTAPGDCRNVACDQTGREVVVNDDRDVPPDDGVECTDSACLDGAPVHPDSAAGTACRNGGFCNASGACVPCIGQRGCDVENGEICFAEAECVSCKDGKKNGHETAVDCGGPDCPGCPGDLCNGAADCQIGLTCKDGTCCDAPCGGPCEACIFSLTGEPNGHCALLKVGTIDGDHCATLGGCGAFKDTCACNDKQLNNNETGVDCGGPCGDCGLCMECSPTGCVPLPAGSESGCGDDSRCDGVGHCKKMYGKACNEAGDCLSNYCPDQGQGVQKVCEHCSAPSDCGDTNEYGCRAGACKKENSQQCESDIECTSYNCNNGGCAGCSNNVDCSSGACNGVNCKYEKGMPCKIGPDCASGNCVQIDSSGQSACK